MKEIISQIMNISEVDIIQDYSREKLIEVLKKAGSLSGGLFLNLGRINGAGG